LATRRRRVELQVWRDLRGRRPAGAHRMLRSMEAHAGDLAA
jgi:hypothetical protein